MVSVIDGCVSTVEEEMLFLDEEEEDSSGWGFDTGMMISHGEVATARVSKAGRLVSL